MRRERVRGVDLIRFEGLEAPGVVHGVTTRQGGVSEGKYGTLNLGLRVGDALPDALANRRRVSAALDVPLESWTCGRQVHQRTVAVATAADRGRGALDVTTSIPETDALVTATPGVTLAAFSADCPLVGLVDPSVPAVGVAHASWRCTVAGIVGLTVARMVEAFGCDPGRMRSAIGPSAGPCCYEVGPEVRDAATAAFDRADWWFATRDGRLYFDLWRANTDQLIAAGLPAEAVESAGLCSICHSDEFFSYRRVKGPVGHIAFLIGLRGD